MATNLAAIGAGPARTSATPAKQIGSGNSLDQTGKFVVPSGEPLPEPAASPPMPVIDISRAVERLNELMSSRQRSLRFEVDAGSGRTVITVINDATKEIVRQIPPEELLHIAQNLEQIGLLIDARI